MQTTKQVKVDETVVVDQKTKKTKWVPIFDKQNVAKIEQPLKKKIIWADEPSDDEDIPDVVTKTEKTEKTKDSNIVMIPKETHYLNRDMIIESGTFGIPYSTNSQSNSRIEGAATNFQLGKMGDNVTRFGFCLNKKCQKETELAPKVGYRCKDCLASLLPRIMSQAAGVNCFAFIGSQAELENMFKKEHVEIQETPMINNHKYLQLDYAGGNYYVEEQQVKVQFLDFPVKKGISPTLVVIKDNESIQKIHKLPGFEKIQPGLCIMNFRGRYVCKNIALGLECYGLTSEKKEFNDQCVAPGAPFWLEVKDVYSKNLGQIVVLEYCRACCDLNANYPDQIGNFDQFRVKQASWSIKPKVEQPKVEQPKVEQPKVEQPKVEQPKVEQPKVEPKVEEPKVEPKEEPKVEPKVDETSSQKKKPVNSIKNSNDQLVISLRNEIVKLLEKNNLLHSENKLLKDEISELTQQNVDLLIKSGQIQN